MTAFSEVYDKSLALMREYTFLDMSDDEIYDTLSPFLKSAEADFARICTESLFDKDDEGYVADLSEEAVDILALGIVCNWMTAYVADADKLQNALGTKDYSVFSPANMLNAVINARDDLILQYRGKTNAYSYLYGNLIRDVVRRGD